MISLFCCIILLFFSNKFINILIFSLLFSIQYNLYDKYIAIDIEINKISIMNIINIFFILNLLSNLATIINEKVYSSFNFSFSFLNSSSNFLYTTVSKNDESDKLLSSSLK